MILLIVLIGLFFTFGPQAANFKTQPQAQGQSSDASVKELEEAASLTAAVVKLFAEAKYDEAFPLAKRALEIRERNLNVDDERVAAAAINLAEIYIVRNKFADAQRLFERALAIYEEKTSSELQLASVLDRLGVVYFNGLHYSDSEKALQRSLVIREKILGRESLVVADSLHKLAEFYRFRGEPKKAEPLYDRALMIMRKSLPLNDPATQRLTEHYSCLLHGTGQFDKLRLLGTKYVPDDVISRTDDALMSGVILNGKAIRLPKPVYPDEARRARVQGIVVIAVTIDERGKVVEAHDMCGTHPLLARVSIEAAYNAEFTPTKLSGQPVKVKGVITYNFVHQ